MEKKQEESLRGIFYYIDFTKEIFIKFKIDFTWSKKGNK